MTYEKRTPTDSIDWSEFERELAEAKTQDRDRLLAENPDIELLDLRRDDDRTRLLELVLRTEVEHATDSMPAVVQRLSHALFCLDAHDLADLHEVLANAAVVFERAARTDSKRGVREALAVANRVAVRIEALAKGETFDDLRALLVDCAEALDEASKAETIAEVREALMPLRSESGQCRALHKLLVETAAVFEAAVTFEDDFR